jgi:PadR family transcriptional regulator, regulatory protein PadR
MIESRNLGEFEMMILLTILRLDNQTYGVPLARELSNLYGRGVALGSVYAALDRLELKRLVLSTLGESTPERGGRAKRMFSVTSEGVRSLHETRRLLSSLWKKLPPMEGEMA